MKKVFLAFAAIVALSGCGFRTTEKTTFSGVTFVDFGSVSSGWFVSFDDVWLKETFGHGKFNVYVWPASSFSERIKIHIDSSLNSTVITVVPSFRSRFYLPYTACYTKQVVIWVSDEREKQIWLSWLKAVDQQYAEALKQQNQPVSPQKVYPSR